MWNDKAESEKIQNLHIQALGVIFEEKSQKW